MADKVCKWCGREFDGRRSGTGGWAVCSESCRQSLASSIDSGETNKNNRISHLGWLVRLFVLFLVFGFIRNGCSTHADKSAVESTSSVEQTSASVEPAAEEPVPERAAEVVAEDTPGEESNDNSSTEGEFARMTAPESETPTAPEQTAGQDTTAIK